MSKRGVQAEKAVSVIALLTVDHLNYLGQARPTQSRQSGGSETRYEDERAQTSCAGHHAADRKQSKS